MSLNNPTKTEIRKGMKMMGVSRGELERALKRGCTLENGAIVGLDWWLKREEMKACIREDYDIGPEEEFYLENPNAIGKL